MRITFYNCSDPTIKLDKNNKNQVGITNATPQPTGPVNIVNPILVIDKDKIPANANYCYIHEYERFYFITSIDWTVANTAIVSCHCDVLSTFGSRLGTLNFVKGAAAINEVEDPNYPVADTFTVERFPLTGWNGLFLNSNSGKRYLLRVADGHAKASTPMVLVGDSILYKNLLFTIHGSWDAAYLSAPQEIPVPPLEAYPLVSNGSRIRVYFQNTEGIISARDYIFSTEQVYDGGVWVETEHLVAVD